MKLEDLIALAKQGYKVADIKELLKLNDTEMQTDKPSGTEKDVTEPEENKNENTQNNTFIPDSSTVNKPESDADAIDYKKLYEDLESKYDDVSKKLEKIQNENIKRNNNGNLPSEEDELFDIAKRFM